MPVYTYECENGHRFEARQSFNDAPLDVCPTCGAKIHRVIQPVGVVFKGSGFYVTDSRGKQNLATSGAKKDEGKSSEGGEAAASTASNGSGENGADKAKTEAGTAVKETAKTTTESKSESKGDSSSKK